VTKLRRLDAVVEAGEPVDHGRRQSDVQGGAAVRGDDDASAVQTAECSVWIVSKRKRLRRFRFAPRRSAVVTIWNPRIRLKASTLSSCQALLAA